MGEEMISVEWLKQYCKAHSICSVAHSHGKPEKCNYKISVKELLRAITAQAKKEMRK